MQKGKPESKANSKRVILHVAVTLYMPKKTKDFIPYTVNVNGVLEHMEKLENIKQLGKMYFANKLAKALGIKTLPTDTTIFIHNLEIQPQHYTAPIKPL